MTTDQHDPARRAGQVAPARKGNRVNGKQMTTGARLDHLASPLALNLRKRYAAF